MKTSELTEAALNWAVAKCEGLEIESVRTLRSGIKSLTLSREGGCPWRPSAVWAQGGPIIEREKIELSPPFTSVDGLEFPTWCATIKDKASQTAYTALGAAMRCFVASKLGDEVDVPEELKTKPFVDHSEGIEFDPRHDINN